MVGCGGGRQADRQSVSQRRNASARQLSAQAFFFFNLCEVTDERCALGKKRKKKRKRHKICLPRWSGRGERREGKGREVGWRQTEFGGSRALREDQTPAQPSPEEIKQACCCAVHYFLSQLGSGPRWRHGHLARVPPLTPA